MKWPFEVSRHAYTIPYCETVSCCGMVALLETHALVVDKTQLLIDISKQRELIASWYQATYFPNEETRFAPSSRTENVISRALKLSYEERNSICHVANYINSVVHDKFHQRSNYIISLLDDVIYRRREPSYRWNEPIEDFKDNQFC